MVLITVMVMMIRSDTLDIDSINNDHVDNYNNGNSDRKLQQ